METGTGPLRPAPNSLPRNTEEGRAFLQSRIARFARVAALFFAAFLPLGIVYRALVPIDGNVQGLRGAFGRGTQMHAAAVAIMLAAWLATRKGRRSIAFLDATDAVLSMLMSASFLVGAWNAEPWVRPDLVGLFVMTLFLTIRAVFIPGTAARSATISAVAALPVVGLTHLYYTQHPRPPPVFPPSAFTLSIAILSLLLIAMTGLLARTVHGLRERVREAMQLGQYTLDEKLGEGGMGTVYKAHHALLRRPTAIKLLPAHRTGEHDLARFEREVQLTSMLTHPNTIAIYDFGRTPEGIFYYVMEYLDGVDLQQLVSADGPQPPERVVHLLSQVCASLSEAHAVGLVHRDVKPANVIVCERGGQPDVVKVLDFGLVRRVANATDDLSRSHVGSVVGTPLYLSPEAIVTPDAIDGRSDLYAVGALGYELLTGEPPFSGATAVEVCARHLHVAPVAPSTRIGAAIDPDLDRLILDCLAKAPDQRPPDAESLRQALLGCKCGDRWTAERARRWWSERGASIRDARSRPPIESDDMKALAVGFRSTVRAQVMDSLAPRAAPDSARRADLEQD